MRTEFRYLCEPPCGRLSIAGALDLSTGSRLRNALRGLAARGCVQLELDLGGVTFIDAYTLRILDREQGRLRADGGDLRVTVASERCQAIVGLAGYGDLQPILPPRPRLRLVSAHGDSVPGPA